MSHALLAFCARPTLPAPLRHELARRAAAVDNWDAALDSAEQHGLGPLLYLHLRRAQVGVAPAVSRQLKGLYVRHRRSNRIRLHALRDIVEALSARSIEVCVLKGPALMDLVYRDSALRPTSDLDLLVAPKHAIAAQEVLRSLGYSAPDARPPSTPGTHHHLPPAWQVIDGLTVQVEVHHNALSNDGRVSLRLDGTRETPVTFDAAGRPTCTLGRHEMVWHLCEHLVGPLPRPLRLISLADVVGWAEAFNDALDWQRVRERYPIVLNVLALSHQLTPLPDALASRLPPETLDAFARAATGDEWLWPSDSRREDVPRWHQLQRSLRPPTWWALLRYGSRNGRVPLAGRLDHMRTVGRAAVRRGVRRPNS